MWQPRYKHASDGTRQLRLQLPKGSLNLTQQLHKSNSKQLQAELRPLFVICILAGAAPISVFPRFHNRIYDALQRAWLSLVYAWLCLAAYEELMHGTMAQRNDVEHKVNSLESFTYLIHVACIFVLSLRWKHRIGLAFDSIGQFDLSCGYVLEPGSVRRFIKRHLALVAAYTSVYLPIAYLSCKYRVWKTLCNLSTFVLPNILSGISLIPYYALLHGVRNRLLTLITSLQQQELHRGLPISREQVQRLRWQHINLLIFTKAVNRTFGVSVLCVYVSSFINFNTTLFLTYKSIEHLDPQEWAWLTYNILWLTMHVGKMFIILYFNQRVQQLQSNLLTLLHRQRAGSIDIMESLNHFVLQLQANLRSNVACGLIVLDYKLIPAILMATTNIFIFFLQYDITYQALSRPANETKF